MLRHRCPYDLTNSIPRKCAIIFLSTVPRLKTVHYLVEFAKFISSVYNSTTMPEVSLPANILITFCRRYAMSLLACGTLVPASLHKCDMGHLGYESFQSITCTDITDTQTFASCSATVRHTPARFSLVTNRDTRYSTTEKQLSPIVNFPLSVALSCYYMSVV